MSDYHFSISIVARHNSRRAEEIAAYLGWTPFNAWSVGDARATPSGTRLPGLRKDTMCSFFHKYSDEDLTGAMVSIIEHLSVRRKFIQDHFASGGTLAINIGLNGKIHSGMVLSPRMLGIIYDLGLQLSVECFPDG